MSKKKKRQWVDIVAPFIVLLVILGVLELIARGGKVAAYVLPAPSAIIFNTIKHFPSDILVDFLFTLKVVVVGFASATVVGIALAAIFSQL